MNSTAPESARFHLTPLELRRRVFHIVLGFVLVGLLSRELITSWHLFVLFVAGMLISWASARSRLPIIGWFLDKFDRPGGRATDWPGRGALTYVVGALLALQLFPADVAYAGILILAVGDGFSPLIGAFGRIRTGLSGTKLLEGTLGGAVLGAFAAMLFLPPYEALLAAGAAMLFEAMEIRLNQRLLDDNLVVPLVAGTTVMLVRHFIG